MLLKKLAVRLLPKPLLMWGKRQYYVRAVPRFWEAEVEPITQIVKPGDVAIDLGANIGWYTCVLARLVGEEGKVLAVEPIPVTFELLSSVVERLGLRNVELFNCAVSDQIGTGIMELPKFEYGGTNFYMAHLITSGPDHAMKDRIEVPLRSLDSFVDGGKAAAVTFVKCDVEGHELAVIKGAEKFFRQSKPVMMIEVAGTAAMQDDPQNEFFSLMRFYGYEAYWFDGKHLRKRMTGHWSVNYFFLQSSHREQLGRLIAE